MTPWRRDPGVLWRRSGGRRLLLPPEGGDLVVLDGPGAIIWDLLVEPARPASLVAALVDAFDVDAETADTEIRAFLDELSTVGAVRRT